MINLIRGSEYQSFLRCRRRWNWEWNEGLKPKKLNDKLFAGSLIHKFLEVLYNEWDAHKAKRTMQNMFLEADTQYSDTLEMADLWEMVDAVTTHYIQYWTDVDAQYKTLATEMEFMVKLDDNICFTGTIDWVFEDLDGHIWFADHKTTSSLEKYEKNSTMDRQISRYWWALQQIAAGVGRVKNKETGQWEVYKPLLDKVIYGFQYNIILKDVPQPPKILKDGTLSKAKSQKTTYKLYVEALHELGISAFPSEYEEILQYLSEQPNRYFKRVEAFRLQEELHAAMMEFYHTADDMTGLASGLEIARNPAELQMMQAVGKDPRDKLYRNITSDCAWDCPYKSLCQAEIEGANTSFLKASTYEKRDVE